MNGQKRARAGRKCSICEHEKVNEINEALIAGEAYRNISERFSVSRAALSRHKNQHIPAALAKAEEAREVVRADSMLAQVTDLRDKALSILTKAERAGELRTALHGIREARSCLELLAKLQGELRQDVTITVIQQQLINDVSIIIREEVDDPVILERIASRLFNLGG